MKHEDEVLVKIKLFKPDYTMSKLNDFLVTHEILRVETYPHARQAGLGNYVGVTYREEGNANATQIQKDSDHQG